MNKSSLITSIAVSTILIFSTFTFAYGTEQPNTNSSQIEQIYTIEKLITHEESLKIADDERIAKATKVRESIELAKQKAAEEEAARIAAEEEAARLNAANKNYGYSTYYYVDENGVLTKSKGVNYYNNRKETWYSQRVLPGGGLNIPGRHVGSDGVIRDADGYICVAASDLPKGSTVETSLGTGKVYDTGCASGTTDIYTDW